jgi:5'-deoxynucleotidase YfbR-like HD superfamily hydrolase
METLNNPNEQDFLFCAFDDSEYGKLLVQRTRFNDFKPDFVDTEMWTNLLGPDVNNLYHMSHTKYLAEQFCELGGVDAETTDLLLTTAITHDIGEAIIGDIALPSKTAEDESREQVAYRKIATELFGDEYGNELSNKVLAVLSHENKEVGDMFRAIEYIGYCSTARRAFLAGESLAHGFIDLGIPRAQKEQLMGGLMALHKAVAVRNFPVLEGYIKKYPQIAPLFWEER